MENLKITLVQPDIIWEDIPANLEKYSKMLSGIVGSDIIVLPEMFNTGFSMQSQKLNEPIDGPSVCWMKNLAAEKNASVIGSLIIKEQDKVYNRAVWIFPDGNLQFYDKRHLFTMGQETEHYAQGTQKTIIEYKGWKFCPLICYDLRFPVWSRNAENYDVLMYVANWPSPRHHVWKNLLAARAIENQSYCIGVNRVGSDGAGLSYLGNSALVDARGNVQMMGETEEVKSFEISYSELQKFRRSFPLLDDMDKFTIAT